MKNLKEQLPFALALITISVLFYLLHFYLFHDPHHLFVFLIEDIAFVFIEVLLVSLILHRVLEAREKQSRMEKMNMVIGVFFNEIGDHLLKQIMMWDKNIQPLKSELCINTQWTNLQFNSARKLIKKHHPDFNKDKITWAPLKSLITGKKEFLIRLLENPNLLEHEAFTEILQSIFHLMQELDARSDFTDLPQSDIKHMTGDIKRVYYNLILQWIDYLEHQKIEYPYLFSLSVRLNPFKENNSPVVK